MSRERNGHDPARRQIRDLAAVADEEGLAERRTNSSDRRKHAVHLTAKGKRTLERARKIATRFADDLLEPLDADEREALRLLLRKLARVDEAAVE